MPVVRAAFGALLGTALIGLVSSLSPIRWDRKALGFVLPRAIDGDLPSGQSILFISPDSSGKHAAISHYGLELRTFPEGRAAWMAFREGVSDTPWDLAWTVDRTGGIFLRQGSEWLSADEGARETLLEGAVLLAADEQTALETRRRLALPPDREVRVLDASRLGFVESPRWRMPFGAIMRTFMVLLVGLMVAGAFAQWLVAGGCDPCMSMAMAFPLTLMAWCSTGYLVGFAGGSFPLWALAGVGLGATLLRGLWTPRARRFAGFKAKAGEDGRPAYSSTIARIIGAMTRMWWFLPAVALWGAFCLFQLDFDGDVFTHWLPSARSHYLLGRHDIAFLVKQFGVAHEATYPPGFPVFLSSLMWASGVPPSAVLDIGVPTHLFVLLYRLTTVALHGSIFAAAWGWLRQYQPKDAPKVWGVWVGLVLALMGMVPLFRGQPTAAEVFLVPIVGFAVLALADGVQWRRGVSMVAGLAFACFCVFIKNDSQVIVLLLMAPWVLWFLLRSRRWSWPSLVTSMGLLALAALPVLTWWIDRARCGADANFMFRPVQLSEVLERPRVLLGTAGAALRLLFSQGGWLVVPLAALGLGAVLRCRPRTPVDLVGAFLVAGGLCAHLAAFGAVFAFSNSDPFMHLHAAYGRIAASAVVAAVIFAASQLMRLGGLSERDHHDPHG